MYEVCKYEVKEYKYLRKKFPDKKNLLRPSVPTVSTNFTFEIDGDEEITKAQKNYQGLYNKALICNEGQKCEIELNDYNDFNDYNDYNDYDN